MRIVIGAAITIIAGYYYFASQSAANVCSNALVSALAAKQCNEVNAIHTIALIGLIIGLAGIAYGVHHEIQLRKSPSYKPPF